MVGLVEGMALEEEGELEGLALLDVERGLPAIEVITTPNFYKQFHNSCQPMTT